MSVVSSDGGYFSPLFLFVKVPGSMSLPRSGAGKTSEPSKKCGWVYLGIGLRCEHVHACRHGQKFRGACRCHVPELFPGCEAFFYCIPAAFRSFSGVYKTSEPSKKCGWVYLGIGLRREHVPAGQQHLITMGRSHHLRWTEGWVGLTQFPGRERRSPTRPACWAIPSSTPKLPNVFKMMRGLLFHSSFLHLFLI